LTQANPVLCTYEPGAIDFSSLYLNFFCDRPAGRANRANAESRQVKKKDINAVKMPNEE